MRNLGMLTLIVDALSKNWDVQNVLRDQPRRAVSETRESNPSTKRENDEKL